MLSGVNWSTGQSIKKGCDGVTADSSQFSSWYNTTLVKSLANHTIISIII